MGVPVQALPDDSNWITWTFNYAMQIVNQYLLYANCPPMPNGWTIYEIAVYNLAGDQLINWAQDVSPPYPPPPATPYFQALRASWDITGFVAGVIQSSGDEGTNESLLVPDFMKGLTLSDLQNLKTPYGRQYLAIAQKFGTLWGLT